jgi:hypothetical protein
MFMNNLREMLKKALETANLSIRAPGGATGWCSFSGTDEGGLWERRISY